MRIAITGGIAEGKSTVLSYIRDLGYTTASADAVAKSVFEDSEVHALLAAMVGEADSLDPEALRKAIAHDPTIRAEVNGIMHPRVMAALDAASAPFIEVPLLLEACIQGRFDRVWVVTCGVEQQASRLTQRLGSPEDARAMMATQLSSEVKVPFSDAVIRTNQPEEAVRRIVSEAVAAVFAP